MSKLWKVLVVTNLVASTAIMLSLFKSDSYSVLLDQIVSLRSLVSKQNDAINELQKRYREADSNYQYLRRVVEEIRVDVESGSFTDGDRYFNEPEESVLEVEKESETHVEYRVYYTHEKCELDKYEAVSLLGSGYGGLYYYLCNADEL